MPMVDTQENQYRTQHPQSQRAGQDGVAGMPLDVSSFLKMQAPCEDRYSSFPLCRSGPVYPASEPQVSLSPDPIQRVSRVLHGWGRPHSAEWELLQSRKEEAGPRLFFHYGGFCTFHSSDLPSLLANEV